MGSYLNSERLDSIATRAITLADRGSCSMSRLSQVRSVREQAI